MVDVADLKFVVPFGACGFESRSGDHWLQLFTHFSQIRVVIALFCAILSLTLELQSCGFTRWRCHLAL